MPRVGNSTTQCYSVLSSEILKYNMCLVFLLFSFQMKDGSFSATAGSGAENDMRLWNFHINNPNFCGVYKSFYCDVTTLKYNATIIHLTAMYAIVHIQDGILS